jgi:hypothetical protein
MTKLVVIMLAMLMAGGLHLLGPATLCASEEAETGEEMIEEQEIMDGEDYRQFFEEESELLEHEDQESEFLEEEEQNYPDETYQEDRG